MSPPSLIPCGFGQLLPFFGGKFGRNEDESDSKPDFGADYKGEWEVVSKDSGVSAMHLILMPKNNKAIMFDATVFGPSNIQLPKSEKCRPVPDSKTNEIDCWAHAVEYDIETAEVRPLKVLTNPWCSSGGLAADGTLVGTGGWKEGGKSVRLLSGCATCDWEDSPNALSGYRWYLMLNDYRYATQQILPDGSFFLLGGRRVFSYEFLPTSGQIIREFPVLPGGSRNYPASGMSALLPLNLQGGNAKDIQAEVLVCGGAKPEAFNLAEKKTFLPALKDCGRIQITNPAAAWKIETMPSRRVMGDMLLLPTGDVLMLNGAEQGTSAWGAAEVPNFTPVLYSPQKPMNERFTELEPTSIARMYHSSSAVLPDGKILVAGSNTNPGYNFKGVKYPTEMRVEKFSPPYLDPSLQAHKPVILQDFSQATLRYGQKFLVKINLSGWDVETTDIKVTMYAPPFTTHGFSMNQRLLILGMNNVNQSFLGFYNIVAMAPPSGQLLRQGIIFSMLFTGVCPALECGFTSSRKGSKAWASFVFLDVFLFDECKLPLCSLTFSSLTNVDP
ncbi:Aldehyde oxidase GLOX1 [Vitis vinifera]|uniref:Aldehyde oxidase GLOX1 n=1 Tax=Vitis vinifera TaxID=29760 RepID=A0A438IHM5_VITVI|nr:Aldehyde oxidase GLOX1 [Vitis vinifera]